MGLFVTMEGPDGSGKSLQLTRLQERLTKAGYQVTVSREPGGTPIGEQIRKVILDPANKAMDPVTEALLYAASRAQHVAEKIRPALSRGDIVLLDRFTDSSCVYQGIGRGLGVSQIEAVNAYATGGLTPDLTLILYIDYEEGLRRKERQAGHQMDRLEEQSEDFYRKVNEGYREMARRHPERIVLLDGALDVDTVSLEIWDHVEKLLRGREGCHKEASS